MRSRLVSAGSSTPSRGGNSTLSRLVTLSSWPDDAPQALGLHRARGPRARPRTRPRSDRAPSPSWPSPSCAFAFVAFVAVFAIAVDPLARSIADATDSGAGNASAGLAIRLRRVDRPLAHDLARVAPPLEALERRLADVTVAGPAADLRPDHELRPDPADAGEVAAPPAAVVRRGRRVERAARPSRGASSSPRSSLRARASNPDPTLPANRSLSSS